MTKADKLQGLSPDIVHSRHERGQSPATGRSGHEGGQSPLNGRSGHEGGQSPLKPREAGRGQSLVALRGTNSWCRRGLASAEVRENGEHAAVVVRDRLEAELPEDRVNVGLDGLRAEEELAPDAGVRAALGHELEDAPLAVCQLLDRVVRPAA